MAVESQQGGDAYFHLGSQPDDDTLVDDIQKLSRIKRAFVEHSPLSRQANCVGRIRFGGACFPVKVSRAK